MSEIQGPLVNKNHKDKKFLIDFSSVPSVWFINEIKTTGKEDTISKKNKQYLHNMLDSFIAEIGY